MKKLIAILLALTVLLGLAACAADGTPTANTNNSSIRPSGTAPSVTSSNIQVPNTQVSTDPLPTQQQYTQGLEYKMTEDGSGYIVVGIGICSDKNIVIPAEYEGKTVTAIDGNAFRGITSIVTVAISDGVTEIGESAFDGCTGLNSITIPNSVTEIGDYAFYECTGLASVTMSNSVTEIGESAFYGCSSLTSIVIPASITSIGPQAFVGSGIESVYISDLAAWCEIDFSNGTSNPLWYNTTLYIDGIAATDIEIPSTVTSLKRFAFYSSELTSITIPESVSSIGDSAFFNCTELASVIIPDSVVNIGRSAFYNCTRLSEIHYNGTMEQWNEIIKGTNELWTPWDGNMRNYTIYCTDGEIKKGE